MLTSCLDCVSGTWDDWSLIGLNLVKSERRVLRHIRVHGRGLVVSQALGLRVAERVVGRGGSWVAASTVEQHAASIKVVEDHLLRVSQAARAGGGRIASSTRRVTGNVVEDLSVPPPKLLPGPPTIQVGLVVHTLTTLMGDPGDELNVGGLQGLSGREPIGTIKNILHLGGKRVTVHRIPL